MGASADAELGADEAAGLLAEIEDVEEHLTARTAGLTWLVWGLAIPGLFATYAGLEPILTSSHFEWILSILWIPWISSGVVATNALWATNAVTLDRSESDRGFGRSALYLLGFFLIAAALWGIVVLLDVAIAGDAVWLLASGLFTVAIGLAARRQAAPGGPAAVAGGGLIVLGGLAAGTQTGWPPGLVNLAGAALIGVVYHAVGGWLYVRG